MIRVLHVVNKMNRGGIETFLMNIYRNIDRKKVQFDFITSKTDTPGDYDEEIISLGGHIYQVSGRRQGLLKRIRELNVFFREHQEFTIIHSHMSSLSNVATLRISKKHNISTRIVHSHNIREGGNKLHKYLHYFNQLTLRSYATDYFACSDLAAKWMYPKKLYENNEFRIINNGIEIEKFAFNEKIRNQKRADLGIENKFVIGNIGRFDQQKNHDFLIDIFKEIYDENNQSVLLLVGDGELKSNIENKVEFLGLTESVIFTGIRSDISELIQTMDVFVFPSRYEGLGIVLIEAQSSGLKCFTSNKVVPKEVNITGLVNFYDLDKSAKIWADEILSNQDYTRNNTTDIVRKGGYDIHQISSELQKWYEIKVKV